MKRFLIVSVVLLSGANAWSADYLSEGPDPGRTGWLKTEKIFTLANVSGSKLLWKIQLDSAPRARHNLFPPLIVERVDTAAGPKQIAVVAGISDDLFAIDADAGTLLWHRHFDSTFVPAQGQVPTLFCPGGQTAVPVVGPTSAPGKYTLYAVSWDGRLRQINVADGEDAAPAQKFMPPNGKVWALNLFQNVIYTSAAQGCGSLPYAFFSFDLATRKTSAFLPAGGGLWGRRGPAIAPDGTVYMGTGDGPYVPEKSQLGQAIVGVKVNAQQELKLTGHFAPKNANYAWKRDLDMNVTPMAFDHKGRHWIVATSKECRVWLLDRDKLGGDDHTTAVETTSLICNDEQLQGGRGVWGATAAWEDASGTQWIVVPFWGPVSKTFHAAIEYGRPMQGGVAAFKLQERDGKFSLTPAWLSRDIVFAEEAIVANGIVFTYGSGEPNQQGVRVERAWDDPQATAGIAPPGGAPVPPTAHATMYALDALTGKELWSSGEQIASVNHFSGMSLANGRAYIGTHDGYLYCFGVAK
jgi:outer membrane protein assembly factor BamB